ncbi:MAG TPA: hypothetical protein VFB62_10130 [Polyangiaceae bacterium]|nr:hypothetical protein [Polyangiaceae bacterium]
MVIGCAQGARRGATHDSPPPSHEAGAAGAGGTTTTGPPVCTALDPCPPGTTCFNGLCAEGCNDRDDCPDGMRCMSDAGQLCVDETVTSCPDVPCASSQVCANGLCSAIPSEEGCTGPTPFGPSDGCGAQEVCLSTAMVDGQEVNAKVCYTFPFCPEDGPCPVGAFGSVCNEGIFPEKNRICLAGMCTSSINCPPAWNCVPAFEGVLYGTCQE